METKLVLKWFSMEITSSIVADLNTWNHVAGVRNGNVFTVY